MKKLWLLVLGGVVINSAQAVGFTDRLDFPTWAEEAIDIVADAGVMTGYGDGSFGHDKSLTRAEAVTLIMRVKVDIEDNYNGVPRFPDVIKGAWYDRAIGLAANNGWIKGHDDGYFYPGKELTRAEFAAMLQRAFALEADDPVLASKYEDVTKNQWFTLPVSAMLENDLLRNALNLNYRPAQAVTRAEAAWTFAQLLSKPGLTGASDAAEVESTTTLDSRRVAIKPRDFDANDQGYEIEREAIHIDVDPAVTDERIEFNRNDSWSPLGVIRFRNTFDYRADLESVRVRLRLEASDMGPAEGFWLRFEGGGILKEEKVYPNGELALTGLDYRLESGEELVLRVAIMAEEEESFYTKNALGKVFVMEASGEAFKTFQSDSRERDIRMAPIEYNSRDLAEFEFDPIVGPGSAQ